MGGHRWSDRSSNGVGHEVRRQVVGVDSTTATTLAKALAVVGGPFCPIVPADTAQQLLHDAHLPPVPACALLRDKVNPGLAGSENEVVLALEITGGAARGWVSS